MQQPFQHMNRFLDSLDRSVAVQPAEVPRGRPPDVRPSRDWIESARGALDRAPADAILVITLEGGQYLTRQEDLLGRKEVAGRPLVWQTALRNLVDGLLR